MTSREERLIDIAQDLLDFDLKRGVLFEGDRQELQQALAGYRGEFLGPEETAEELQPPWTVWPVEPEDAYYGSPEYLADMEFWS